MTPFITRVEIMDDLIGRINPLVATSGKFDTVYAGLRVIAFFPFFLAVNTH